MHWIEEAGSGGFENRKDFLFAFGERFGKWALLSEQWQLVGEKKSDASVALADGIDSGPRNFTRGDQRVQPCRFISGNACGKDGGFEQRRRNGSALQAFDGIEQDIEMRMRNPPGRQQSLPMGEKSCQRVLLNGFDFPAKPGQRFAADLAQNLRIAPLALKASGTETSLKNTALHRELMQGILNNGRIKRKALCCFPQGERAVRPSITADEFENRMLHRIDQ